MGHDVFGVVPYQLRTIVIVGNAIGNGYVDVFHEIDGQAPVRLLR